MQAFLMSHPCMLLVIPNPRLSAPPSFSPSKKSGSIEPGEELPTRAVGETHTWGWHDRPSSMRQLALLEK